MNGIVTKCQGDLVRVETEIGSFEGLWRSSKPAEFKEYDFELDCEDLIEQDSIQLSSVLSPLICNEESGVRINALVEEVEDGVIFLRLLGSIMMITFSDDCNFAEYVGQYVTIRISCLELYDTGIY